MIELNIEEVVLTLQTTEQDSIFELVNQNGTAVLDLKFENNCFVIIDNSKSKLFENKDFVLKELDFLAKQFINEGYSGIETEEYENKSRNNKEIANDPFNPEEISIETKKVSMDTLLRRLEQGTIRLNPDFQRKEVWSIDRKSQLIESMILNIPIPMFYVSSDEKGNWTVVDGLQRISTIRDFILGKKYLSDIEKFRKYKGVGFSLVGLEFWKDFNGMKLRELPVHLYNRVLETEFTFTVINPGTPEEVRRNIFKRLNTGGLPLSSQEIRNALYNGKSTNLLNRLAGYQEFKIATCNSIHTERMEDKELILRFIAFYVRKYNTYLKTLPIDTWLSDTMIILNAMPNLDTREFKKSIKSGTLSKDTISETTEAEIEKVFKLAMVRASDIFGVHAFRKSYGILRRTPINKSLFETWGVILAALKDDEFNTLKKNKNKFIQEYAEIIDNWQFQIEISRNSMKHSSVKSRFEKLNTLVQNNI